MGVLSKNTGPKPRHDLNHREQLAVKNGYFSAMNYFGFILVNSTVLSENKADRKAGGSFDIVTRIYSSLLAKFHAAMHCLDLKHV